MPGVQATPQRYVEPPPRSISGDFSKFQSLHALHKVHQPHSDLEWTYYQAGQSNDIETIVFLHGTSGTAASFFYQVQALSEKGYRVLSVQYPWFSTPAEWCKGFDLFLDCVKLHSCHVFGAGLGGFLVQHYAAKYPQRVRSIMLCNSFATTHAFAEQAGALANMVWLMPTPLLRQALLDAFPKGPMELVAKQAIDWVALQIADLSGNDIASRLSLNCNPSWVSTFGNQTRVTIMESRGSTMVPDELRRQLQSMYPEGRQAQLKATGDFPYVSRHDEVTLFVEVHLRGVGVITSRDCRLTAAALQPGMSGVTAFQEAEGPGLPPTEEQDEFQQYLRETKQKESAAAAHRRPVWINPFEDDPLL